MIYMERSWKELQETAKDRKDWHELVQGLFYCWIKAGEELIAAFVAALNENNLIQR